MCMLKTTHISSCHYSGGTSCWSNSFIYVSFSEAWQQKAVIPPKWRKSECVAIPNRLLTPTIWSYREACGQSMGALVCPVNTARTASQPTGNKEVCVSFQTCASWSVPSAMIFSSYGSKLYIEGATVNSEFAVRNLHVENRLSVCLQS